MKDTAEIANKRLTLRTELSGALGSSVHFDVGHRANHASDASNYRQVPIGAVVLKSLHPFVAAIAIGRRHGAPVLMGGGGTSMNGQTINRVVVLDMSAFCRKILELDPVDIPDNCVAANAVPEYETFSPIAIDGLDRSIIRGLQSRNMAAAKISLLPEGDARVVTAFGADSAVAAVEWRGRLTSTPGTSTSPGRFAHMCYCRRRARRATIRSSPPTVPVAANRFATLPDEN
jgi:hypothetical protein